MNKENRINYRELVLDDYESVANLWSTTEGMSLGSSDSKEGFERFLIRNPGSSFSAEIDGLIVGAVLAGHDSRRGYIYHLAVAPLYRKRGIGKALLNYSVTALLKEGIDKVHIFVFKDNVTGISFWDSTGWLRREDIFIYTKER